MNTALRPAFLLILILFCLTGCSKPRVELVVASQPNVNPDQTGRPSPVMMKMFELRGDLAFKQADFEALFHRPMQTLGADLVAADDLVFIPGEARRVIYQPNLNTRYIGVVAGFRHLERAHWRMIRAVDPEKENFVALELNDTTILVVPESEAEDWDPEKAVRLFQQQLRRQPESPATAAPSGMALPAGSQAAVSAAAEDTASPAVEAQPLVPVRVEAAPLPRESVTIQYPDDEPMAEDTVLSYELPAMRSL